MTKADYKLNMGKSEFKLNELHTNKQQYIDLWYNDEIDEKLHQDKNPNKFMGLDGCMYANGSLHFGHFANKVLKDSILRFKRLCGVNAPFFITSDQHGLPIEIAVEKTSNKENTIQFLNDCRHYAKEQFDIQFKEVQSFGVIASNTTYATSDYAYEALEMKQLHSLYKKGLLKQKLRPVPFCKECNSSLAEAEVEYKDKQSDSLIVKFPVATNTFLLIWTTTPYTLIANKAVAFNKRNTYVKWLHTNTNEYYITSISYAVSIDVSYEIVDLNSYKHALSPITKENVPIVNADYVNIESGTGLVHIAPSFGNDDYNVGMTYGLPVETYIDNDGRCVVDGLEGKSIKELSVYVLGCLKECDLIHNLDKIMHSTGHCWRHKIPLFYKASNEWFFDLETILEKYDSDTIDFYPKKSRNRLDSMMGNRKSWCISRNRKWGVPIPFFYDLDGNIHPDNDILVEEAIQLVSEYGINAWHTMDVSEGIVKSTQIADVWFDSALLNEYLTKDILCSVQSDLFLEGTDQHRGWFNSSMILGLANNEISPFKQLITHGFVVDEFGRKLSKSNGNYVSMEELFKTSSPDVLRLLILGQTYENDMVLSKELLAQTVEKYKKIRNTFRFCMQNLSDFEYKDHDPWNISIFDEQQIYKLMMLQETVYKAMNTYDFKKAVYEIYRFAEDCSKYFDIVKDTLYCDTVDSIARRGVQTTLFHLLHDFSKLVSFALPYTGEEVYQWIKKFDIDDGVGYSIKSSVVLTSLNLLKYLDQGGEVAIHLKEEISDTMFSSLDSLRDEINKEFEGMRNSNLKTLGQIKLMISPEYNIPLSYIQQYLGLAEAEYKDIVKYELVVTDNTKCSRCWQYNITNGHDYCNRCDFIMRG